MGWDNPFDLLDAEERIRIAQLRLERTRWLMGEVISLTAQRKAFIEAQRNFSDASYRATTTLLVTIVYFELLQVCRLWDAPELSGYSLPSLAALLDDPDVLAKAAQMAGEADSNGGAAARVAGLQRAIELCKTTESSDELHALRTYRHKMVAHAIIKPRGKRMRNLPDDMPWTDNPIDRAAEVLAAFITLADGVPFSYEPLVREEHGAARELFWNLHYQGPPSSRPFGDRSGAPSLTEAPENPNEAGDTEQEARW
jgi:hypothetical protein